MNKNMKIKLGTLFLFSFGVGLPFQNNTKGPPAIVVVVYAGHWF